MRRIFKENKLYFSLVTIFAIIGGIYLACSERSDAILYFNSHRSAFGDAFFKIATKLGEEPMYFIICIALFAWRLRASLLVAITGLLVMGISFCSKMFFAVDRPLAFFRKNEKLDGLNFVEGIDIHTGATSFPSGHTMSAFALYAILTFMLINSKKNLGTVLLFLAAVLVGVSRVYLIQHFWEDVYAGAFIGIAIAMAVYAVNLKYPYNPQLQIDKPLFKLKRNRTA